MGKYLNREQVVADFKVNVYPSLKNMFGDNFEEISKIWVLNLEGHLADKSISKSQKNKWKLTEKDLI